jgi:hypothetical protein
MAAPCLIFGVAPSKKGAALNLVAIEAFLCGVAFADVLIGLGSLW